MSLLQEIQMMIALKNLGKMSTGRKNGRDSKEKRVLQLIQKK